DPDEFDALIEIPGVVPAPYMARNKWIQIQEFDGVPRAEVKRLLSKSYDIVKAKLPKDASRRVGQAGEVQEANSGAVTTLRRVLRQGLADVRTQVCLDTLPTVL